MRFFLFAFMIVISFYSYARGEIDSTEKSATISSEESALRKEDRKSCETATLRVGDGYPINATQHEIWQNMCFGLKSNLGVSIRPSCLNASSGGINAKKNICHRLTF